MINKMPTSIDLLRELFITKALRNILRENNLLLQITKLKLYRAKLTSSLKDIFETPVNLKLKLCEVSMVSFKIFAGV